MFYKSLVRIYLLCCCNSYNEYEKALSSKLSQEYEII
jgi:hypothetical protein